MMDRFAAMDAFARIAETGSFSATARLLRLSKSQISRQISSLEAELGAQLFQRTTRSLSLTEAGRAYYTRVTQILAQVEEADLSVRQLQSAPRGKLRVNAPISFTIRRLAPWLPNFQTLYPEIEIDMVMNDRVIDLLNEEFDLAIRIGRLVDSSLIARKLAPVRRVVCASPAYLDLHGVPAVPEDLKRHATLCYSNSDGIDEWRFVGPDGRLLPVRVKSKLHANNGDLLLIAAQHGMGIVDLPDFIVGNDLATGRLVALLEDFVHQESAVYAVYPRGRYLSPKVRVFIDFLAKHWGADNDWPDIVPQL
jgi:DNA-binding transcriptional LysR family regulator